MTIETFFHGPTWTLTYLVYDPVTNDAFVVDPVLDFDPAPVSITTETADELVDRIRELGLKVHLVLETHAHADHMSAADLLRRRLGARVAVGAAVPRLILPSLQVNLRAGKLPPKDANGRAFLKLPINLFA